MSEYMCVYVCVDLGVTCVSSAVRYRSKAGEAELELIAAMKAFEESQAKLKASALCSPPPCAA